MIDYEMDRPHLRDADEVRRRIIRNMSVAEKIDAAMAMFWSYREQIAAGIRRDFPHWSEAQIQRAVAVAIQFPLD